MPGPPVGSSGAAAPGAALVLARMGRRGVAAHGEELARVRDLELSLEQGALRGLPPLAGLERLTLRGMRLDRRAVARLAEVAAGTREIALLGCRLEAPLAPLWGAAAGLRSIWVEDCLGRLGWPSEARGVRRLRVMGTRLEPPGTAGPEGLEELCADRVGWTALPRLPHSVHTLVLPRNRCAGPAERLPQALRSVDLSGWPLSEGLRAALAQRPLASLRLADCGLEVEALAPLLGPALELLVLDGNPLGPSVLGVLEALRPQRPALGLRRTWLGPAEAQRLWPGVVVGERRIEPTLLALLRSADAGQRAQGLELLAGLDADGSRLAVLAGGSSIDAEGRLRVGPGLPQMRSGRLDLALSLLGLIGALATVRRLELDGAQHRVRRLGTLEAVPAALEQAGALETLTLAHHRIEHLPGWLIAHPRLRRLDLRGNRLWQVEGGVLPGPRLVELDLRGNRRLPALPAGWQRAGLRIRLGRA